MLPDKLLACALSVTLLILFHPFYGLTTAAAVTGDDAVQVAVPSARRDADKAAVPAEQADGGEQPGTDEEAEEAEPDPAAEIWSLVEETQTAIDAVLVIEPRIEEATGEQRAVLVEQQRVKRLEARKLFTALIDKLAKMKKEGVDDRGASKEAGRFLDRVMLWAEERMENTRAVIETLRAERENASAEDLLKIEERLSAANSEYDQMLDGWLQMSLAHEAIGLDASEPFTRLD
ncbi:MAG: hypothetical protein V3R77_07300, partial [Candidatus Binatia bacterium]